MPGEVAGENSRPARRREGRRRRRHPDLGALLPAQPGALDGRLAGLGRRGPLERRRPRSGAGGTKPRRLRSRRTARRALSGAGGVLSVPYLGPLAGRGRRVAPGEGDSPRIRYSWRQPLTPTLSPQKAGRGRRTSPKIAVQDAAINSRQLFQI